MKFTLTLSFISITLFVSFCVGIALIVIFPSGTKWTDLGIGLVTGVVVGVSLYLIDTQRAARERELADADARQRDEERDRQAAERAEDALTAERQNQTILVQLVLQAREIRHVRLDGADMRSMSFKSRPIQDSRFSRCNFSASDFSSTLIEDTDFVDCKMVQADFRFAKVHNASFAGSNLLNCDFDRAQFSGCNFVGANVSDVNWGNASFSNCLGVEHIS